MGLEDSVERAVAALDVLGRAVQGTLDEPEPISTAAEMGSRNVCNVSLRVRAPGQVYPLYFVYYFTFLLDMLNFCMKHNDALFVMSALSIHDKWNQEIDTIHCNFLG